MKIQEKVQNTINVIVGEAKSNFDVVKEQISNTVAEVSAAAKEEMEMQKTAFAAYKERVNTLREKGFKREEVLNSIKEEATFYGNEVTVAFNRNIEKVKSIVSPRISTVMETVKETTDKVAGEFKKVQEQAVEVKEEVEDKVAEVVEG